jgi:hypothetical protein
MKLLLQWDIRPELERSYFEFIVREFAPGLTELGLNLTEAWYTSYGSGPQIHVTGVAQDKETIYQILSSEAWQKLYRQLDRYIYNFSQKIVPDRGGFQL